MTNQPEGEEVDQIDMLVEMETRRVNRQFEAARKVAATWEPGPMPSDWEGV